MPDAGSQAPHAATSTLVIDPEPYRKRAVAMLDDENPKVRALADVVRVLCDHYVELCDVYDVGAGHIIRRGTWPE